MVNMSVFKGFIGIYLFLLFICGLINFVRYISTSWATETQAARRRAVMQAFVNEFNELERQREDLDGGR